MRPEATHNNSEHLTQDDLSSGGCTWDTMALRAIHRAVDRPLYPEADRARTSVWAGRFGEPMKEDPDSPHRILLSRMKDQRSHSKDE